MSRVMQHKNKPVSILEELKVIWALQQRLSVL